VEVSQRPRPEELDESGSRRGKSCTNTKCSSSSSTAICVCRICNAVPLDLLLCVVLCCSVLLRVLFIFLLSGWFWQGAKLINLQRAGLDPDPILLSYIPALDLIREMCKDVWNKTRFIVKPEIKVKEVHRSPTGGIKLIREYDHPSTGTFLGHAQNRVDPDKSLKATSAFCHILFEACVFLL
jgi:hypothetical protein